MFLNEYVLIKINASYIYEKISRTYLFCPMCYIILKRKLNPSPFRETVKPLLESMREEARNAYIHCELMWLGDMEVKTP